MQQSGQTKFAVDVCSSAMLVAINNSVSFRWQFRPRPLTVASPQYGDRSNLSVGSPDNIMLLQH